MCQLAAYIGDRPIAPLLMDALRLQEGYFGGQATGLGVLDKGLLSWVKQPGSVDHVIANSNIMGLTGTTGIAHSRLSETSVTDERYNRAKNAHPFTNTDNSIALMHNGIITNYEQYWAELAKHYTFKGYNEDINYITDSEVVAHMVDQMVSEGKQLEDAVRETANKLNGMVLLGVISVDEPETVYITNWIQACTLAVGKDEAMFCSSPLGFGHVADDFDIFTAPRNSFIKMTRDGFEISRLDKNRDAPATPVDWMGFRDEVIRMLGECGKQTCLSLLLKLNEAGGERLFGVSLGEWKELQRIGWGDQNQITDNLNLMYKEGLVNRTVEQHQEGGITVPRIVWSLP
jgi:glucosamine--fructose-6-phosphate aminotransferase (isomerizing)